jgi:hypothetical protein
MPDPTTIHFVNHASYLQRHGGTRLLVDPWVSGDAFDHGWSLLAPTATPLDVLADATHIWVSHEHPDHFAPSFFHSIPKERRAAITVLYQRTKDRKVVQFVEKLGYPTRELTNGEWVRIGDDFEVLCESVPIDDSYLVTRGGGVTTVNMNDCAHLSRAALRRLRRRVPRIDVLFTQFGYASWQGAPDATELRRQLARAQLARITHQVEALRPTYAVPYASFIYFSAKENGYMNDANNKVADADAHLRALGVRPVVMYPGDEWQVGAPHDSAPAIQRWTERYALPKTEYQATSIPIEELAKLADAYSARMLEFHSRRMIRLLNAVRLGFFGPIDIYLHDHERAVRFGIFEGLTTTDLRREDCAATMHSESLGFVLKFDYGLNTLSVNGRFIADTGGFKRLVRAFGLGSLKNSGERFAPELLTERSVWLAASRAFLQRRS